MFENGIIIDGDYRTMPGKLEIIKRAEDEEDVSEVMVTICEGRFHQVKKMIAAIGCKVIYLKRISIGGVRLDEGLAPGGYRELTPEELAKLKGVTK